MSEEGPEVWEYKRAAVFEGCDCDGPGVMGGIALKEDGKTYCTSCGKKLNVSGFILYGCSKCVKPKLKALDDLEKEVFNLK